MRINLIKVGTVDVAPSQNECGGNVSLIPKEHSFEEGAGRDYATGGGGAVETQEFHLGCDGFGGFFCVGGRAGSAAVNVGCDVVDFVAVFVCYGGVVCGAGVGS